MAAVCVCVCWLKLLSHLQQWVDGSVLVALLGVQHSADHLLVQVGEHVLQGLQFCFTAHGLLVPDGRHGTRHGQGHHSLVVDSGHSWQHMIQIRLVNNPRPFTWDVLTAQANNKRFTHMLGNKTTRHLCPNSFRYRWLDIKQVCVEARGLFIGQWNKYWNFHWLLMEGSKMKTLCGTTLFHCVHVLCLTCDGHISHSLLIHWRHQHHGLRHHSCWYGLRHKHTEG